MTKILVEIDPKQQRVVPVKLTAEIEDELHNIMTNCHTVEESWIDIISAAPQPEPVDYCVSDFDLAQMILSDCGISNHQNENLASRIADRIAKHTKPAPVSGEQPPDQSARISKLEEALKVANDALMLINKLDDDRDFLGQPEYEFVYGALTNIKEALES